MCASLWFLEQISLAIFPSICYDEPSLIRWFRPIRYRLCRRRMDICVKFSGDVMSNIISLKLYSEKEVISITTLSRSTIYRLSKEGRFPKPLWISERRKAYSVEDIQDWVNRRKAA